jgi:hypothetical protein
MNNLQERVKTVIDLHFCYDSEFIYCQKVEYLVRLPQYMATCGRRQIYTRDSANGVKVRTSCWLPRRNLFDDLWLSTDWVSVAMALMSHAPTQPSMAQLFLWLGWQPNSLNPAPLLAHSAATTPSPLIRAPVPAPVEAADYSQLVVNIPTEYL